MFTKPTDTNKSVIFSVLVLSLERISKPPHGAPRRRSYSPNMGTMPVIRSLCASTVLCHA